MRFLRNLIYLCVLFPLILKAQDLVLSDDLTITQAQIDKLYKLLPRTTEDRTFYHWTSKATAMRWVTQKHISDGEMNFLNSPTGEKQSFGPGFYIAEKSTSSKSFGEAAVSLIIKKNTLLLDQEIVRKVVGRALFDNEASKLGQRIPFIRNAKDDWYVLNSTQFTADLFYGGYSSPDSRVYIQKPENWKPFAFANDFRDLINNGDQDAVYLKKILVASDYMDGISFARAMKVNPGAPWTEFEPENFYKYERVLDNISKDLEIIKEKGSKDIKEAILDVYNRMAESSHSDLEKAIRTEGIMAGGDEKGKTFLATHEDLKILKANPYLEVQFTPDGNGKCLVNYYYPDVFHFKKLKKFISPELYENLLKMSPEELINNHELRKKLNKKLILQLVENFSKKMNKGKGNWKDLISIHPFEDKNGRTIRMLQKIFQPEVSHIALSDFDLLRPIEEQELHWSSNAKAHQNLQKAFIEEFMKSKTERRMPDYIKTGALEIYANEVLPTPVKIDLNSNNDLEQIRKRQWVNLIEEGRAEGIQELIQKLKNPLTHESAIENLLNYTKPSLDASYTKNERSSLFSEIVNQINNSKVTNKSRVDLILAFENAVLDSRTSSDPAFTAAKKEFMNDVLKRFSTTKTVTAGVEYLEVIEILEKDKYKLINLYFDMYSMKEYENIKDKIRSITQDLIHASYYESLDIEARKFFYTNIKEIMKRMSTIDSGYFYTSSILESYQNLYEDLKVKGKPDLPSVSALKKEMLLWGSNNPGKDNCVLNILRNVFP